MFSEQEVSTHSQDIQVIYIGSTLILEYKCIVSIFDATIQLAKEIYKEFTDNNRKERRLIFYDDL